MYKMKTKITAIAPDATKQKWIPFLSHFSVHTVANRAWLSFADDSRITELPHEELNPQWLRIKYVYWQVRATTSRPAHNDFELLKAYNAGATVSTQVCSGVKLYEQTTLRKRDEELPS